MVRLQVPLSGARIRSLSNKVFFIGIVSGNKRDTEKTHIDYRIDNGNNLVVKLEQSKKRIGDGVHRFHIAHKVSGRVHHLRRLSGRSTRSGRCEPRILLPFCVANSSRGRLQTHIHQRAARLRAGAHCPPSDKQRGNRRFKPTYRHQERVMQPLTRRDRPRPRCRPPYMDFARTTENHGGRYVRSRPPSVSRLDTIQPGL